MDRLTLHEAQERVAAIYQREGYGPSTVRWDDLEQEIVRFAIGADKAPVLSRSAIAAGEICDILRAHLRHVLHVAGQKAATDAILAYAARNDGLALDVFARDVREGLHYAEPGEG